MNPSPDLISFPIPQGKWILDVAYNDENDNAKEKHKRVSVQLKIAKEGINESVEVKMDNSSLLEEIEKYTILQVHLPSLLTRTK